jgi:two-component system chemotaxis sensor kinase CheA
MDDLGGFEVLKQLKADSKMRHIPVFLLTNMGEKGNTEEGLKLGAEAYIMKAKTLPSDIVNLVTSRLNKI